MKESTALSVFSYENHPVSFTMLGGTPTVPVRDIEAALGYEPKGLSKSIPDWQAQGLMKEDGSHVRKLTGADLDVFAVPGSGTTNSMTRNLLVLTERGLYRVLILSRKPAAIAFQDWLECVVLPSIARTGGYNTDKRIEAMEARIQALEATLPLARQAPIPKTQQYLFPSSGLVERLEAWTSGKYRIRSCEYKAETGAVESLKAIGSTLKAMGFRMVNTGRVRWYVR